MNSNRESLAWAMMLGGFTIFIALCFTVPVAINAYLHAATRPLALTIQANQGAVTALNPATGTSAVLLPGTPLSDLEAGATIITSTLADTALLQVNDPQTDTLLVRATIYGSSQLLVEEAAAPRYGLSDRERQLILNLRHGRIRVVTPVNRALDFRLELWLEDVARLRIEQSGQYSLQRVNGQIQVTVQSGQATLVANDQELLLQSGERAFIDDDYRLLGPLTAERNLVRNSSFQQGLTEWALLPWNIEREDQPTGKLEIINDEGGRTLLFERVGVGHADASVRQTINQDVTDFQELRVLMTFRLLSQSLAICGNLGSECPLTLRIEYEDAIGTTRVWQQGFYVDAAFDPAAPTICESCVPPYMEHQPAPQAQLFAYESENLIELLAQRGLLPPARIRNLSLIVAGHSFTVEVVEVALIALD
jgi:hypothetical protein